MADFQIQFSQKLLIFEWKIFILQFFAYFHTQNYLFLSNSQFYVYLKIFQIRKLKIFFFFSRFIFMYLCRITWITWFLWRHPIYKILLTYWKFEMARTKQIIENLFISFLFWINWIHSKLFWKYRFIRPTHVKSAIKPKY